MLSHFLSQTPFLLWEITSEEEIDDYIDRQSTNVPSQVPSPILLCVREGEGQAHMRVSSIQAIRIRSLVRNVDIHHPTAKSTLFEAVFLKPSMREVATYRADVPCTRDDDPLPYSSKVHPRQ